MASTHGKCQFVADNHKGCSVLGLSPWTLSLQIFISWKISSKQINKLTVPARTLSLTLITTMFTDHLTMGSQTMTRSNTETLKSTFRIFLLYLGKQGSLHQVFKRKKKKRKGRERNSALETCGVFSCSMWDLVPWPGIESQALCIGSTES